MCEISSAYALRLEDKVEDLAHEKNQLIIENNNLNDVIKEMASTLVSQGSCFAQKHEDHCFDPKYIDMCTDCTINYFKDRVKKNG